MLKEFIRRENIDCVSICVMLILLQFKNKILPESEMIDAGSHQNNFAKCYD